MLFHALASYTVHTCTCRLYTGLCSLLSSQHSFRIARIWRKDELPLCFLIVLHVCSTDHLSQKCCALSKDVAWQTCLPEQCVCWQCSSRAGWVRITALKKYFCNVFFRLKAFPSSNFKIEKNIHSQMTKRNSSKRPLVSRPLQSWDLASAGRAH